MTAIGQEPGEIWLAERDVFDFLNAVEDGSLAGVLTDVPYPTTERHRARGSTTRTKDTKGSSNPWYGVLSVEALCDVLRLLYAKMAKNAYAFVYVDDSTYLLLAQRLKMIDALDKLTQPGVADSRAPRDSIGFGWWTPCTWVKTTLDSEPIHDWYAKHGRGDGPAAKWNDYKAVKLRAGTGYHGQATTERILILEKGASQLREKFPNAFLEPRPQARPPGATLAAASPKPVRIAERLTRAMAAPGDVVCDPFVGCGHHAEGIVRTGAHALVNDLDASLARDWLANVHKREINDWE